MSKLSVSSFFFVLCFVSVIFGQAIDVDDDIIDESTDFSTFFTLSSVGVYSSVFIPFYTSFIETYVESGPFRVSTFDNGDIDDDEWNNFSPVSAIDPFSPNSIIFESDDDGYTTITFWDDDDNNNNSESKSCEHHHNHGNHHNHSNHHNHREENSVFKYEDNDIEDPNLMLLFLIVSFCGGFVVAVLTFVSVVTLCLVIKMYSQKYASKKGTTTPGYEPVPINA
eukprot:TRINITY_DN1532_c0_g1_i2.p1 TRINITY_DN1532_c0_g1~~TRINITY_DN1532_c0_g1_i2.p1  ORF type:complete len:231 (+),score=8.53 TRINITY_DN1532_c0_g1_i2:22-693(+)